MAPHRKHRLDWRPSRATRFSLIELMVVLVIIGMVVGLVGMNIGAMGEGARQKSTKTQIKLLSNCVKMFYLDMGEYPNALSELVENPGGSKWSGPYVEENVIPKDGWNEEFHYTAPGTDGRPFDIVSYGRDKQPGGEGFDRDIGNWPDEQE